MFTEKAACQAPGFASQLRYRTVADMYEKAAKHYRRAALLQERGEPELAQAHIHIARQHAISAMVMNPILQNDIPTTLMPL